MVNSMGEDANNTNTFTTNKPLIGSNAMIEDQIDLPKEAPKHYGLELEAGEYVLALTPKPKQEPTDGR